MIAWDRLRSFWKLRCSPPKAVSCLVAAGVVWNATLMLRAQEPAPRVPALTPSGDVVDNIRSALEPLQQRPRSSDLDGGGTPFQPRLPRELLPPADTLETRRQFEQFIPKVIDPQQTLNLLVGQPRILTFAATAAKPQLKLYLPDESIARWDILSDTEVSIVGLQPGNTVLTIWVQDPAAPQGRRVLSYRVRVYEDPQYRESLNDLEARIRELFPNSRVQLSLVRDRLVVRGQAKDAIEAGQILTVLAQTRNGGPTGRGAGMETRASNLMIDRDPTRMDDEAAERRSVFDASAISSAGIINLLVIPGEQQVTLRVTLAEVNRSALRSIGANLEIGNGQDVSFLSLLLPAGFDATPGGNFAVNTSDFRLALNALRRLGYARTLAEPNLTALNGKPASFRSGDTFPVPSAELAFGGVGQGVAQQFAGVEVQFIPHIVDRDRIRLQVRGEVSARDDTQSANVGGTNVPGLNTRNFFTTVELREGQTLAMAGLLQTTLQSDARRVPWLGDFPVVGTLFSHKNNSATEQELIVLVTPELAHPLEPGDAPPLPGSDVFEPTDVEFYLTNRLESRRSMDYRSPVRTDYQRMKRIERCCYDEYIVGPNGYSERCRTSSTSSARMPRPESLPPPITHQLKD